MKIEKVAIAVVALVFLFVVVVAQDHSTGTIKGKVRVANGSPAGVLVEVRQEDREITHLRTERNGDFKVAGLTPGVYSLTFRKPGLSVATIDKVEIKAGQTRSLADKLVLAVDEGSIAFIRGSIFNGAGRSLPNARVELARILDDGTVKKIDGRVTNDTGSFSFRLTPDPAKYRVTAKADHMQPAFKDVVVDSAVVYRVAISLEPEPK
jgi:hypothetical protein